MVTLILDTILHKIITATPLNQTEMKTPMEWYEVAGLVLLSIFFLVAVLTDGFDFTLYREQKNKTKEKWEK